MKTYLVTLTPQEPYFFGNEKTFIFEKEKNQGQRGNSYYISSERTPLQSTLMGMMRFILMPYKNHKHPEQNAPVIGSESFKIDAVNQSFGVIKKIYPLFLMKDGEKFIVTPFDCKPNVTAYTPFSNYQSIITADGEKLFTSGYDSKEGLADSYMRLSDGALVYADSIFGTEMRVGNLKTTDRKNENGFFKKEYRYLKEDYRFAFYVDLDDNAVLPNSGKTQAFLGQGKSLFNVYFEEQENTLAEDVKKHLPADVSYCLSDFFTDSMVLHYCKFAVIQTRDYRAYITNLDGKITKDSVLYKLIKAGSVFIIKDKEGFGGLVNKDNCQLAGFNCIVAKEEKV